MELISLHRAEYGVAPEVIASSPGTVNIMGEHTDYNAGYVLLIGLDKYLSVAVSRRKDNSLRFYAADYNERKRTTLANLKYKREDRWANYSKGVIFGLIKRGHKIKGLDITIKSEIPQEIGLSSSAALCAATVAALRDLYAVDITDNEAIHIAYEAEKTFVGKEVEITEHMAVFISRAHHALFFDARALTYDYIPLTFTNPKLLLTVSNVPAVPVDAELKELREECKHCVNLLNKKKQGIALRDYIILDLQQSLGFIPENSRRLCLHVVEENQRVLDSKEALLNKDMIVFGKILNRSHESLRDNFEVSCPEIDWLVKRAWEIDGVLGSRLTGKGFGGCTITLLMENALKTYLERLDEYERIFGFCATTITIEPTGGTKIALKEIRKD